MQLAEAYRNGTVAMFRTGTAFPNLDVRGILDQVLIVMPTQPISERFAEFFLASRGSELWTQSRMLAAIRDALLPKLLSGAMRVRAAEKVVEAHA